MYPPAESTNHLSQTFLAQPQTESWFDQFQLHQDGAIGGGHRVYAA